MSINLQVKQFPKLYDYNGVFIAELTEALSVNESLRFGSIGQLDFDYPKFQVDSYNNVMYDSNGEPITNPKSEYLKNDIRCLYNNSWYILKVDEDYRDDNNKLKIKCSAYSIGYNLQELMVQSLILVPPLANSVNATTAISQVLESAQQVRDSKVVSASGSAVTLDIYAHPTNDIYNGYKIKILSGTGSGQERTITAYNGTTKVATLSSAFSPLPDTTSVYRIYNDIWRVGTVASVYNTDLRSHKFDFVNGLSALEQVRDKYFDANDQVGYLTYSSSYNSTTGRWENLVNLVSATTYAGVDFRYRKNIKAITRRKESQEIYTRIIPEGVDNLTVGSIATSNRTDSSITYPEHNFGYNYIDNFKYFLEQGYTYKQCMDNFVKVYRFSDVRYTTPTALYNDAKKILEKMAIPKYTYLMTILDLSKLTGREYESFQIGDTIRVVDEDLGIDIYTVISSMEVSQDTPQNSTVELTNYVDNMTDIIRKIVNRNDDYASIKAQYGNTVTYIVADKLTSKNWRQADFVVQEFEYASDVIQKVIDNIDANKGGRIVLMEGDYYINTVLTLKSNILLEGQGSATVLLPLRASLMCITASNSINVAICNLKITNNNSIYFENGIGIYSSTNPSVFRNIISGITNNGVILQSSSIISLYENLIEAYGTNMLDGIDLKDCNGASIYNNTFKGNIGSLRVINIENLSTGIVGKYNVNNNIFDLSTISRLYGVIAILGGATPITADMQINIVFNIISVNSGTSSVDGVYVQNCPNVNISNNTIEGNLRNGVYLFYVTRVNVVENTINIAGSTPNAIPGVYDNFGIVLDTQTIGCNIQKNTISHNTPKTNTTNAPNAFYAIYDKNGQNNIIANNDMYGYGANAITGAGTGRVLLGGNRT